MAGVDLAYDSDGLRSGGRAALGAGEVAAGAAGTCAARPARRPRWVWSRAPKRWPPRWPGPATRTWRWPSGCTPVTSTCDGRAGRAAGDGDGLTASYGRGGPHRSPAVTAPAGVVDLSLPDYPTLVARAGVDPARRRPRVAGADPGTVAGAGAASAGPAARWTGPGRGSLGAADTLGAGVHQRRGAGAGPGDPRRRTCPRSSGDAGTRLAGTARPGGRGGRRPDGDQAGRPRPR